MQDGDDTGGAPQDAQNRAPDTGPVFEYLARDILGETLTFVLDRHSDDWYATRMRGAGMLSPVLPHLQALRRICGDPPPPYADFGANIGVSALYPARLGFPTLAVEAGARNLTLLAEAVTANDLAPLCRPCLMAAAAGRGVATFDEYSAWGTLVVAGRGQPFEFSRARPGEVRRSVVPTDTIAGILIQQGFADAACIKIDIEGNELYALTGFEAIAARPALRDLIVETNGRHCTRMGYPPQALWARLAELGFATYLLNGQRLAPVGPDDPQPLPGMDVLATRRDPAELTGAFGYAITPYSRAEAATLLAKVLANPATLDEVARFAATQQAMIA